VADLSLLGRVAVVTGGGSGIGRAACLALAADGARVMVADLVLASAQATQQAIEAAGGSAAAIQVDVAEPADCERMAQLTCDVLGGLDVLVNNAGIDLPRATTVVDTAPADWDRVFAVNLKGVYLGCKFALPHMVLQGSGAIVNTASIAGILQGPANAAYAVSKAGVIALTKQVARDYAPFGVRSNCVCPGVMQTPMQDYRPLWQSDDAEQQQVLADRRQVVARRHPMGRLVQPEEVAQAIVYLASSRAAYVTGQALAVDGGWLIGQ
jgi:NAD(P)-dependent dehydrogenase (short-subunit alcohol dehydrogenase family)